MGRVSEVSGAIAQTTTGRKVIVTWLMMGCTLKNWCRKVIQQRKSSARCPANAATGYAVARGSAVAAQVQHELLARDPFAAGDRVEAVDREALQEP